MGNLCYLYRDERNSFCFYFYIRKIFHKAQDSLFERIHRVSDCKKKQHILYRCYLSSSWWLTIAPMSIRQFSNHLIDQQINHLSVRHLNILPAIRSTNCLFVGPFDSQSLYRFLIFFSSDAIIWTRSHYAQMGNAFTFNGVQITSWGCIN